MFLSRHGIEPEKVIEKSESAVLLEFTVPQSSDFFDGHFPEIQLLPAVAQIDLMLNFAHKYFGTSRSCLSTKRTKFAAPIFPDTKVRMEIKFNKEKASLAYKIFALDGEKTYSTGTFKISV